MYKKILYILLLTPLFFGCGGSSKDSTPPTFTTGDTIHIFEGSTAITTVTADDTSMVSFAITAGEDQSRLTIDVHSGALSFLVAPDFENPIDAGADNSYHVTIEATDSYQNSATLDLTIHIKDKDEIPPHITSDSQATIRENSTFALQVTVDNETSVSYQIMDAEDGDQFYFSGSNLRSRTALDFEHPGDLNSDNNYSLTISVTDRAGNHTEQGLHITVTDIDESTSSDSDNDGIPDNIEVLIESNLSDSDVNGNGINDGLDTEGAYGDTFFDMQWHIRSIDGTATNNSGVLTIGENDLDLVDLYHTYMGYNHGEHIIVQVVDTGVDADHEDLIENMDRSRSYNAGEIGDPSGSGTHGTMVAGIMAARAFNGKGVRGIIPFARIAGSNWLDTQRTDELEKVWLTGAGANEITVTNNSWGMFSDSNTLYEGIMKEGSITLRNGKGRIYTFAAGNDRERGGNAQLQYMLSNRYSVVVAALRHDKIHAVYSNPGANILVSGYSGDYYNTSPTIGTTTIMGQSNHSGDVSSQTTWSGDTQENYTFVMNGTSAAAPTVAASIALVLEACPDLTWRDVRYLIAKHAEQVDAGNSSWVDNHAGLHHSPDYGFGLISAKEMINDCTGGYTLLGAEHNESITKTFNQSIADHTTATFELNITQAISTEWVELTIDNNISRASDYRVELTSPSGTKILLLPENVGIHDSWMIGGFRLSTPAFMSEDANGSWQVDISDRFTDRVGTVRTIKLQLYGH